MSNIEKNNFFNTLDSLTQQQKKRDHVIFEITSFPSPLPEEKDAYQLKPSSFSELSEYLSCPNCLLTRSKKRVKPTPSGLNLPLFAESESDNRFLGITHHFLLQVMHDRSGLEESGKSEKKLISTFSEKPELIRSEGFYDHLTQSGKQEVVNYLRGLSDSSFRTSIGLPLQRYAKDILMDPNGEVLESEKRVFFFLESGKQNFQIVNRKDRDKIPFEVKFDQIRKRNNNIEIVDFKERVQLNNVNALQLGTYLLGFQEYLAQEPGVVKQIKLPRIGNMGDLALPSLLLFDLKNSKSFQLRIPERKLNNFMKYLFNTLVLTYLAKKAGFAQPNPDHAHLATQLIDNYSLPASKRIQTSDGSLSAQECYQLALISFEKFSQSYIWEEVKNGMTKETLSYSTLPVDLYIAPRKELPKIKNFQLSDNKWHELESISGQKKQKERPYFSGEAVIKRIFQNRRIIEADEQNKYRLPDLEKLTLEEAGISPLAYQNTVKRVVEAIRNKEGIAIFGDYDVDGQTSTAILRECLKEFNCFPLEVKIPSRKNGEGYGITGQYVDYLLNKNKEKNCNKVSLLITIDNGINSQAILKQATDNGIDVLVLDHHEKKSDNQEEENVLHTTELSAAGIAWFVSKGIFEAFGRKQPDNQTELVFYAAIGDSMPLIGVNRVLAVAGMQQARQTKRPGIRRIMRRAGIDKNMQQNIDEDTIRFVINPQINALGRNGDPNIAQELFLNKNDLVCETYAQIAESENHERKYQQRINTHAAFTKIDAYEEKNGKKDIKVVGISCPPGIIGLVASEIVKKYNTPAVVIALGGKECRGSARSVEGIDIRRLLETQALLMSSFGGHKGAAGFSISRDNLIAFRAAVENAISDFPRVENPIFADCKILLKYRKSIAQSIRTLAPFGPGNPKPLFQADNVLLGEMKPDPKYKWVLTVSQGSSSRIRLIARGLWDHVRPYNEQPVDIQFTIEQDFTAKEADQEVLNLKAIRPSK